MLQTRRSAIRLAKRLRNQPPRRLESNHSSRHSEHAHEAHHHAGPVNEHFGRGFYLSIASIPVAYVLYAFTTNNPDAPPLFTRIINSYSQYEERWVQRNALHTAMIEQAAFDRNLFQGSERSQMIDLKFPEVFNTGSPYNIHAGQQTNLDALIRHYRQKNREMEEKVAKKTPEQRFATQ